MKILDYIFCDDIRFEIHGKYSLIGLYQDSINIETKDPATIQWPIALRLGILVRLQVSEEIAKRQEIQFDFDFKFKNNRIGSTQGSLMINDATSTTIALPMGPYQILVPSPGEFTFTLRLSQAGKELALLAPKNRLPVRVRQVAAPA
jgi:hypothetical protein